MTSSNGNIFRATGFCAGNSPVTGEFPSQRPVTRIYDVFFICTWINAWVNNREAGNLRRHRAHYDVTVMMTNRCRILRVHWWISFKSFLVLPHGTQGIIFLTNWGRDRMVAILQTTFPLSWMRMYQLRLKSLFPMVQLTIFNHWVK